MGCSYANHIKKFEFRVRTCACILNCVLVIINTHFKMLVSAVIQASRIFTALKMCREQKFRFIFPEPHNAAVMCSY